MKEVLWDQSDGLHLFIHLSNDTKMMLDNVAAPQNRSPSRLQWFMNFSQTTRKAFDMQQCSCCICFPVNWHLVSSNCLFIIWDWTPKLNPDAKF